VLILNNNFQGMVKQWQDLFYDERHSHTDMINPDFVKMAEVRGEEHIFIVTMEVSVLTMKDTKKATLIFIPLPSFPQKKNLPYLGLWCTRPQGDE
jgi:thiamine pyrophosphate-dependent acetolactate synthase large subunit-like protein